MAIIRKWSGDGLTAGALTTSSAALGDDPFTAVIGNPQINAGGPRVPRIAFAQTTGAASVVYWTYAPLTTASFRIYFTTPMSWPTGSFQIMHLQNGVGVVSGFISISAGTDPGRIRISDSTAIIRIASDAILTTNTRYRVEVTVVHGTTGTMTARVYMGDQTTPIAISGANTVLSAVGNYLTQHTVGRFGNSATSPTVTFYLDDIAVNNTSALIGPYVNTEPPVETQWSFIRFARFG